MSAETAFTGSAAATAPHLDAADARRGLLNETAHCQVFHSGLHIAEPTHRRGA